MDSENNIFPHFVYAVLGFYMPAGTKWDNTGVSVFWLYRTERLVMVMWHSMDLNFRHCTFSSVSQNLKHCVHLNLYTTFGFLNKRPRRKCFLLSSEWNPLKIDSGLVLSFTSGVLWPYRIRACKITTKRHFSHFSVHKGLQFSTPALIDCKMSDLKLSLWIQKPVFTSSEREDFFGWG